MKVRGLFLSVFILTLVLDQVSKAVTRASFDQGQAYPLWPGVFELTLTYNKGIAFGQLQGYGLLLAPIALLIAGYAFWHSWTHPTDKKITHIAMALLASGALGNLIDRLVFQKVTDMFWFRLIDFPVFNVADSCISVAAAILLVVWTSESIGAKNQTQPVKAEPSEPTGTI